MNRRGFIMKGRYLLGSKEAVVESNIFADKSALVLDWLLRAGVKEKEFSLREVANVNGVSIGLVQKVFGTLVLMGLLQTEGLRTAKKFIFKKSGHLFKSWLEQYSVVKKCKMWTYRSGFQGKDELIEALKKSKLHAKVALALHSAAEAYKCKNTNLTTLELYLLDPKIRSKLEDTLQLEPQERGYEVLLIEPYYKSLLKQNIGSENDLKICPALLTFLDLYHYPLRGREQAEFMAERIPELKSLLKKS
jgi:hypothetical protein